MGDPLPNSDSMIEVADVDLMVYHRHQYYSHLRSFYQTEEDFLRAVAPDFIQLSPISPDSTLSPIDFDDDDAYKMLLVTDIICQMEWESLPDDDGSSYNDEDNMQQQSNLTPSREHESDKQMFKELTLDAIFGDTNNQELTSAVETCQSSQIISNEGCVKVEDDDLWDFLIKYDQIELSSVVNENQYDYLYDSSSFELINEDNGSPAFDFDDYYQVPNKDEMQGVTGGNLVIQTNPSKIEDTYTIGPQIASQPIPRTTDVESNESGKKRKWFEVSGDGDNGVNIHNEFHQSNTYPNI